SNTTGERNHFSGYLAGTRNTTGGANHFSGFQAGQNNTTGSGNYFSGYLAGQSNTTGGNNHFSGYLAGTRNTTGGANHFSGFQAGRANTTGSNNYFSGFLAGPNNTTGSENVYIGYRAGVIGNYTNAIAIGANVSARGNNTVTIGNSNHTSIGGYQPWSNLSDGRFKREVAEDVPGLEFVTRLRPVSYQVDRAALHAFLQGEEDESQPSPLAQPRETGFIAQEVEEVAKALGYQFNGIIRPQSENDHYQLSYATFVVPLVQAVQEQQELIKALQAENARLTQDNAAQQTQLDQLGSLQHRLQALENLLNQQTQASASNQ
ncbi:MAG: tail fiber domain-containing protein, partial [Bacteroidota bacterium]